MSDPRLARAAIWLILGFFFFVFAFEIPSKTIAANQDPGPRVLPLSISILVLAGGLAEALLVFAIPTKNAPKRLVVGRTKSAELSEVETSTQSNNDADPSDVASIAAASPEQRTALDDLPFSWLSLVMILGYLVLIPIVGFFVATLALSVGWCVRARTRVLTMLILPPLLVASIWLLFARLFEVRFPTGFWGN